MTAPEGRDGYHVSRTDGDLALEHLARAGWDTLLSHSSPRDPVRAMTWLSTWRSIPGAGAAASAVLVDRDRRLVAAAPLERVSRGGLRVVQHLAQGDAWFHIEPPARDDAARRTLLEAVAAEPGDILLLDGFRGDEATAELLHAAIPRVRLIRAVTWRLTLAEPPRSMRKRRKEAGRAQRRARERGTELTVSGTGDWSRIGPRLEHLLDFHAAHFPGDGLNKLAGPGVRREFARAGISALGEQGAVRLVEVTTGDGAMVAFDLAFVAGDDAVAYTGAFDRSRPELRDLGWISVLAMIELLGEDGVATLDFGPGPAAYKDLVASEVPLLRAMAPLSAAGRAALAGRAVATHATALHDRLRRLRARRNGSGSGEG